MQPGVPSDPPSDPTLSRQPAAGWPPAPGQWGPPPGGAPADEPAAPPQPTRTGRPGVVALVAVLIEIIAIAAADNQVVARRVSTAVSDDVGTTTFNFAQALLTYQWRFTPLDTDQFHILYAQFALLAVVLAGTFALVLAAARRGAGFWPVFAATWAAVVATSGVGAIVRGLVVDSRLLGDQSRLQFALFSVFGPSNSVFVGGFALGLLVGLGAGVTAAVVRSTGEAVAAQPVAPAAPVPSPISGPPPAYGPADDATQQHRPVDTTQEFRPVDTTQQYRPVDTTQQLPTVDERPPPGDGRTAS